MSMYELKERDVGAVAHKLAASFHDDPLYEHLFPDASARARCLAGFFHAYIMRSYNSSFMYSDSPRLGSFIMVCRKPDRRPFVRRFAADSAFVLRILRIHELYLPPRKLSRIFMSHNMLRGDWNGRYAAADYLYLSITAVDKGLRGTGVFRKVIQPFLDWSDEDGLPITLETHNHKNTGVYEHLGFEVAKVIENPGCSFRQYCMVRRPG